MNEFVKNAIDSLIDVSTPSDLLEVLLYLYSIDEDFCVQISLDEYNRSVISSELSREISDPESDLLSYFMNDKLYFIDNEILDGMIRKEGENYNFGVDYSVLLDTNYASYINTFLNNPQNLNSKVKSTIDILLKNEVRFDYMIYIIENYFNVFLKAEGDEKVLQDNRANFYLNLVNLELFKNINRDKYLQSGKIDFTIAKSEAYLLADKLYNNILNSPNSFKGLKNYYNIHQMMILYIIGILKVRFSSNKAPHNKMVDIFVFMNEVAGLYFEREIKFTYEYISNPNKYKIFDRIQKGMKKSKLFEIVKNIAWDFSIPRIMENFFADFSMTRYFIPLFLTHDNNMKTVFSSYNVKGVIFNKDKTFFSVYSDIRIHEYLYSKKCKINFEEFFSDEATKSRVVLHNKNKNEEFKAIEREFNSLAKILNCK
ncbi:MAG: hypothetical protein FH761_19215 [Firmicutes bacterium]|nr:hypothetical protein [Bacillota bacterium]